MEKSVPDDSLCAILATAPSHNVATSIANVLLKENLIACATIIANATSLYRWQGENRIEEEVQIIFKTRIDTVTKLQHRFTSLHPYSVPEFLVIPVASAFQPYKEWVSSEVKP